MAQQSLYNDRAKCGKEYDINVGESTISLTLISTIQPVLEYFHIKIKDPSQLETISHKYVKRDKTLEMVYGCAARSIGPWRDKVISALLKEQKVGPLAEYMHTLPEAEINIYDCPACAHIGDIVGGLADMELTSD